MWFFNLFRLFLSLLIFIPYFFFNKNHAVFVFLKFAGPSFIKLGQILSTRPDLVGEELARILSKFQDKLDPFSTQKVKEILAAEFGDIKKTFTEFDLKPVASASIAQVHRAKLLDGSEVAVKILRPNIRRIMARDIKTLNVFVKIIAIFSRFLSKTFGDIASLLKEVSKSELDLLLEASNASQIKENLSDVEGFYIPEIHWKISTSQILVLEWINGTPFSNKEALLSTNHDKKQIAKNLVTAYFEQVYGHGFFHADMHPGNLILMENGDIAAIDFGIVGKIDKKTRLAIAEILIGYLNKDYKKVAQAHIDAEFVPSNTSLTDLTLAIRKIGESIVGANVKDIPLSSLLESLVTMTRDYQMSTKPELLLLQKAILLIEGVGVSLDKDLNIWDLAKPWVRNWAKQNIGFDAKIRDSLLDLIKLAKEFVKKI